MLSVRKHSDIPTNRSQILLLFLTTIPTPGPHHHHLLPGLFQ
jgi:hypothetical protein